MGRMVEVTYLSFKMPHVGHIAWLKAIKALGHNVKVTSLREFMTIAPNPHGVLVTEGVRPTMCGAIFGPFYKSWVAVANSPSILKPMINQLYKMPSLVIAVSNLVRSLIDNEAVVLHPVPPELEALLKIEVDHHSKRPWIFFSGAFIPIKGLHMIPDIALRLKEEGIKALFMLVGGSQEEPLARLIIDKARRLGVAEYLKIVGALPRAHLFRSLSRSSIYLQPSLFDAFPISVVEAMALGVTPVITKYVGARDVLELVSASLVREPRPDDIVEALKRLLTDPKALREYSTLSRDVVKTTLSFKSVVDKLNTILESCLN